MINHINTLSPLRAAGKKIDTRGQRKIVIMSDRTFMKRMKAGEILVYTYKIFVFIHKIFMYKRAKNCVGIDLARSMKTFRFKNLGLDRLIGDNKKFC